MTIWAVVLVFVGALNPFRRRGALSVERAHDVVVGSVVALGVYVAISLVANGARDALDVSAPNARIAAGLVLLAVGLHATLAQLVVYPLGATRRAWLVPVLFPVLLRPDLALVALAADGAAGVAIVSIAAALALGATAAWWATRGNVASGRAERGLGAATGAVLVLAAVRLLLDGVFAV